ncbi:hypothetical protein WJ977_21250 [Achromobacter xylosoxidans]
MTFSPSPARRAAWWRVLFAGGLLSVAALAVVTYVQSVDLANSMKERASNTQIRAVEGRVASLQEQFDSYRRQPAPVSQATFTNAKGAWEARLQMLEDAADGAARREEVEALRRSLTETQAELEALRRAPTPPRPAASPAKRPARIPLPAPVQILGIESRGGERFLSLAPTGDATLGRARLLRLGESDGNWRLDAIEGHRAVFQVHGQTRHLAIP